MLRLFTLACLACIVSVAESVSLGSLRQSGIKNGSSLFDKTRNVVFPENQDDARFKQSSPLFLLHILKHKQNIQKIEKVTTVSPTANCICVPYYLCDVNQTIIMDGVGVIDVRFRRCSGDLEVCCYLPNISTLAPVVTPPTTPTTPPTTPTTPPTTPTTPPTTPTTPPTTPTTPPTTPTTPPTTPTTPPTTPTTPPTTPTTPPTTATTPPTTPTTPTPTMTIPTAPPIIFPTDPPTIAPTPSPTVPPGLNCICVLIWQCDPNGIVSFAGEGVINPRQQFGICPGENQVCCRILASGIELPTPPTTVPPTTAAPIISPTILPGIPEQTQICIICGNAIQCNTGIIISSGAGIINPRLIYPGQQGVCSASNSLCCQSPMDPADGNAVLNNLGTLKNPGTDQACYCVKTWLCTEGNVVSVDGAGIIDPRFTSCASADEVCCRIEGIDVKSLRELSSTQGEYIVNDGPSRTQLACGLQNKTYAPPQSYPQDSGKTYFAEFPWMVALLVSQANGQYLFQCGASLINNRAVLTAAHCVTNRENGKLVARFGQWDLERKDQPAPFQEVDVKTIIPHPLYYSGGLYHDVAVLILEKPVTFDVNINSICLPQQGMSFAVGTKCFGTGWGRNSFGADGKYQAELRKVELPIVDRSDCQTQLRSTRLGQYFQLHGSFICAGGELNKDTCRGDGGGPLACPTSTGQFVQAGIVSWGIGCGTSNVPAVYASVSQHRQWIDQQLAAYGVQ